MMRRTIFAIAISLVAAVGLAAQTVGTGTIVSGADYEYGFSPGPGALQVVEDAISGARQSILVACYEFTSWPIAEALVKAERRGVKVAVVADERASEEGYSRVPFLAREGIPVRLDSRFRFMHDKFMVIDGTEVETGSFNYTAGAVRDNAENAILLEGVPNLAAGYARDWQWLWDQSRPIETRGWARSAQRR